MKLRVIASVSGALLLAACGSTGSSGGSAPSGSSAPASAPATSTAAVSPSPSSSAVPASGSRTQPDGSVQVTDADLGYQVTLPRGYVRITKRSDLEKIAKAGSKIAKGELAQISASAFAANVKVFAVNRLSGSTINLVVTDSGGALSSDLADQSDALKQTLENQLGATGVRMSTTTVDGSAAVRADATLKTAIGSLALIQVYAVHGDHFYITSFGKASEPVIAQVTRSEHFF